MTQTSLVVCEGDGVLVVRGHSLENVIAIPKLCAELTTAQLIVIGLSLALENDEWRERLVERTRAKLVEQRDGISPQ